ncbi:hypothetical protein KL915_005066 [Ogataea haglerorum]|nr:hypothetical protein KL915_005066 [Ogataea haglerorum]
MLGKMVRIPTGQRRGENFKLLKLGLLHLRNQDMRSFCAAMPKALRNPPCSRSSIKGMPFPAFHLPKAMKLSSFSLVASSLLSLVAAAPVTLLKRDNRWDYKNDKIYGVNIGGWLVLEPYITPSLFEAVSSGVPVDEYHYTEALGKEEAERRLQEHWSTWIREEDFKGMADVGLNFVRLPIGYWAFQLAEGDPYVQGQQEYLDKALEWCAKYGLKAWVDLHGAPGSQNGFDNSGKRGEIGWQNTTGYVDLTIQVLDQIASKYGGSNYSDVIIGIELLNEPLGSNLDFDELVDFYNKGYQLVRDNGNAPVIIHDAYLPDHTFDNVLNTEQDPNVWEVIVDHHHYQVFDVGSLSQSVDEHVSTACGWGQSENTEYHYTLCGEWTAALTDCAKWLNGAGRGARYDATFGGGNYIGSCDQLYTANYDYFTPEVISNYRRYVEAQMDSFLYGKNAGWVFWCWKTENTIEWDMQRLIGLGIIPQPFDDRQYPNQCGFD